MKNKIITIPNPKLRQANQPLQQVDKKTRQLLADLREQLIASGGVGLAAPQIAQNYRVFATHLDRLGDDSPTANIKKKADPVRFFINPQIVACPAQKEFSKDNDGSYTLEGCLSLPGLYAPLPRYPWVELAFQEIDPQHPDQLIDRREKFTDYFARNIQHEYDHLEGILFTDYLKDNNVILYKVNPVTDRLEEVKDLQFIYGY